jgi:hypothetical protein
MTMCKKEVYFNCPEKCLNALTSIIPRFYRKEEIDRIRWLNDEETEETYALHYIDHNLREKRLVLFRESGCVTLE